MWCPASFIINIFKRKGFDFKSEIFCCPTFHSPLQIINIYVALLVCVSDCVQHERVMYCIQTVQYWLCRYSCTVLFAVTCRLCFPLHVIVVRHYCQADSCLQGRGGRGPRHPAQQVRRRPHLPDRGTAPVEANTRGALKAPTALQAPPAPFQKPTNLFTPRSVMFSQPNK